MAYTLQTIPLQTIITDPNQPRNIPATLEALEQLAKQDDGHAQAILTKIKTLATSILDVGLQQPISVYPQGERYIVLDGHRRWLATCLLTQQGHGDGRIACYVQSKPRAEDDILLTQLVANIQREDLNVFELARSTASLKERLQSNGGLVRIEREDGTIEIETLHPHSSDKVVWQTIERKLGISRPRRYQIQAVLTLPPNVQQRAEAANLPESRLRYVIPLNDEQIQAQIIEEIIEGNLSNAAIKKRIKALLTEAESEEAHPMPKPMQIKSAIKPIRRLRQELDAVKNVAGALNKKDPRTVQNYETLLPEIKEAINDLQAVLDKLAYLEK